MRGCGGGADGGGGGARSGPAAGRVARRSSPAPALAPFPVPGRSSLWTASCCWGGWLVLLLRGCDACRAVGGGLQSGAALIGVRLDVGSLPPRSSSQTVEIGSYFLFLQEHIKDIIIIWRSSSQMTPAL